MAVRKFRCNERRFLNMNGWHGNASIVAYVERGLKTSRRSPHAYLTISDCSHQVEFSIDTYNAEGRKNSLHKIDTMIAVLTKFRAAFVAECGRFGDDDAEEDY